MKLFLAGGSGLVGSHVARVAERRGWEVTATVWKSNAPVEGAVGVLRLDLGDEHAVQRAVLDLFPDAIVNAAACSEPSLCDADPNGSHKVNALLPGVIARLAQHLGARLVHLSSEQVFDGTGAPYGRDDPVSPVNLYGRQKAEGELAVAREAAAESVVVRLPLLGGNSLSGTRSLHERLFSAWAAGRRTRLYRDEIRQPCSAENVAKVTVELCERTDLHGIHHWAGSESLSRLDMGRRIAAHFHLPVEDLVEAGCRADHPGGSASRQADLSLDCRPLTGLLKTHQESFDEMLANLAVPPPCQAWYRKPA